MAVWEGSVIKTFSLMLWDSYTVSRFLVHVESIWKRAVLSLLPSLDSWELRICVLLLTGAHVGSNLDLFLRPSWYYGRLPSDRNGG